MKFSGLMVVAILAITSQLVKADDTCAKNGRKKLAADTLSKVISREIGRLPGGLDGFDSLEVTDVGTGKVCGMQWAKKVLGLPMQSIGEFPSCGIVYYFSNEDALKTFSKSSLALQTPSTIRQSLTKEGHIGDSVGPGDTETFNVSVCAALKK